MVPGKNEILENKNPNETPDKKPVGRPSEMTADIIKTARYYLENWMTIDSEDALPTIEGLAYYLEVSRKTLYNWAKDEKNEEFLHIFEKIQTKQAKILLSNGLKGVFNSTITKLMLSKHDYYDKVETDNKHTVVVDKEAKEEADKALNEVLEPENNIKKDVNNTGDIKQQ